MNKSDQNFTTKKPLFTSGFLYKFRSVYLPNFIFKFLSNSSRNSSVYK